MGKKIVSVVGARPQFVKIAALLKEVKRPIAIVHTGQHYDEKMSSIFFDELKIPKPDYRLAIGGLSQGAMTGRMIEAVEGILLKERPDWLLLFGDTNTTLAAAIAGSKLHIPIAHVEAGLRSFNRAMPEEINRVLTDHCSTLNFTPTKRATERLLAEGIEGERIREVGDIMYDIAIFARSLLKERCQKGGGEKKRPPYILATIHRQSNCDDPKRLAAIARELMALAEMREVIMPLHPRAEKALKAAKLYESCRERLTLLDPVGYLEMAALESGAELIVTDSGGVQKEAFFFRVPCITVRGETEWVELVEGGYNRLVDPAVRGSLLEAYGAMMEKSYDWELPLYGDGSAAKKIIAAIKEFSP